MLSAVPVQKSAKTQNFAAKPGARERRSHSRAQNGTRASSCVSHSPTPPAALHAPSVRSASPGG